MAKKPKPTTSEAQLRATANYQKGKARFILWYPEGVKRDLETTMDSKGVKPREVFEAGLKALKIPLPKDEG